MCGTVFLVGSWLRYDYGQYTWRAASSQMTDKKGMRFVSNVFHIGIIGIFFGHLFGLLTPYWMYEPFLAIATKQKIAMGAGDRYLPGQRLGVAGRGRVDLPRASDPRHDNFPRFSLHPTGPRLERAG
nr:Respiratory nitrate reductase 1 gamma chain [Candidatus Pantoea persica]